MIEYDQQEQERFNRFMKDLEEKSAFELSHPDTFMEAFTMEFREEALRLGLLVELPNELKSLSSLLRQFLLTKKFEGCSSSTLNGYGSILYAFLYSLKKSPLEITAADIRSYLIEYQQRNHCTNRTLDNLRLVFSSFYNWLEDESYIVKNPTKKIKRIKYDKVIMQAFTDEDIEALRDACKSYRDLALVDFLYSTGCRVSEVVSLDIGDLDFIQREAVIFGKGKKERIVYFNAKTKIHLMRYIASRQDKNPALFVGSKYPYRRLDRSGIEYICSELGEKAGVQHCHPHRFRRTLATNLIDKGVPIEQVQVLLGHSKIDTTLLYANVNQANVKNNHKRHI